MERGPTQATHSSAAPQTESTIGVQLDGVEVKLAEHAVVLESLHARFEEHKMVMSERFQALEDLLKRALVTQAENGSG